MTNTQPEPITWKKFKENVLSKTEGWIEHNGPGTLESKMGEYPALEFKLYVIKRGPLEAPGRWASSDGAMIHERDLSGTTKWLHWFERPKSA